MELGTLEETIDESGTVALGDQQTLKAPFEAGGVVERANARAGDRVVIPTPDLQLELGMTLAPQDSSQKP